MSDGKKPTKLNLFDSTCLIVGIVVGSGIYETPSGVARAVDHSWEIYFLWTLGGLISVCGAMCYAELATTYPQSGGDVVYLSRAYGKRAGFLFGWLQTFVARPGDISLMALVFAHYLHVVIDPAATGPHPIWPAIAIVSLLTAVNIVGLQFGKTTQNVLTVCKIVGLLVIVGVAFVPNSAPPIVPDEPPEKLSWGVALILVLFTFGGWNEMVYVASEVDRPKRNISRALIAGAVAVTILYLLANWAYLRSLGVAGMANSSAIATDAVGAVLPRSGKLLVALVITISAAGAINGLVLTGARITGAMKSYSGFRWLSHWNPHFRTPARSLVLEGVISICVIVIAQTFENALIYTSAAVYSFYLATAFSTAILRRRDTTSERAFRMPLFPLPLIIFVLGCTWTIYSAFEYKRSAALICLGVLTTGWLAYDFQTVDEGRESAEE